ncbi:MAG: response regulator transcription factor [Polyangiaceae bacterium]
MRVVLADDHRIMRDGLRAVLTAAGVQVVGEAGDGEAAIAEADRSHPDVVVIDIAMPKLSGIEATRRLRAKMPGTKVIALSMNSDRRYVMAMLEAGAAGYLLKDAAADELLVALDAVGRGETYLSPAIAAGVVDRALRARPSPSSGSDKPLSAREREVVQRIAEGKSSKEIATILHIAVPTVDTHRRQIMDKLHLRTIAELTKYAIREGLTSAER